MNQIQPNLQKLPEELKKPFREFYVAAINLFDVFEPRPAEHHAKALQSLDEDLAADTVLLEQVEDQMYITAQILARFAQENRFK